MEAIRSCSAGARNEPPGDVPTTSCILRLETFLLPCAHELGGGREGGTFTLTFRGPRPKPSPADHTDATGRVGAVASPPLGHGDTTVFHSFQVPQMDSQNRMSILEDCLVTDPLGPVDVGAWGVNGFFPASRHLGTSSSPRVTRRVSFVLKRGQLLPGGQARAGKPRQQP